MKLDVLISGNHGRFIVNPSRVDSPLLLPPLEFGNVVPVELRGWQETASGEIVAVDLSEYQISLQVGKRNSRARLGFWQLTTTAGTSLPISCAAESEAVVLALAGALGIVTVEGGNGSYIITVKAPGVWALPTATFQGNTLSSVLVFQITPGTIDTPAQFRVEVLEVAPARIVPAHWVTGSTTPENSFSQISGRLWQLAISPFVDNGFFTLSIDGRQTDFIAFNGGAYSIATALAAIGKPAEVVRNGTGGYWLKFSQDTVIATIGGNLVILPWCKGNLDLTSTGLRELLDGLQFTDVKLSLILVKDGQTATVASADVLLTMPINQPATITIDAPQMAGLTFALTEDQTTLEVYQNGELVGTVELLTP